MDSPAISSRRSSDAPPNTLPSHLAFTQPLVMVFAVLQGYGTSLLTIALVLTGLNKLLPDSFCPSQANEPRTRPRPQQPRTRSKRSSSEASTTSTASTASSSASFAGGVPDELLSGRVSVGINNLLNLWPAKKFKNNQRIPAALRFNSYHELDQVKESEEESALGAGSPVAERAELFGGAAAAEGDDAPRAEPPRLDEHSSEHEHGGLTDGDSQSDCTSEADTLEDRQSCESPASSSGKAKGFGNWFKGKSRRRAQSDEASRSESSLASSTATAFSSQPTSTSTSSSLHCPIQERRRAKKAASASGSKPSSPSLSPTRPKLTSANSASPTCAAPKPTRSFSLNRPKSTACLRSASLDIAPINTAPAPAMSINLSVDSAPSKASALQRWRAKSPFSPKARSPLASPIASPPLSPALSASGASLSPTGGRGGLSFLRRKSWDSDRLAVPPPAAPLDRHQLQRGRRRTDSPDLLHI